MPITTVKAISDFRNAPYSHFNFSSSNKVNQPPKKTPSRRKRWYKKWQRISPSYLEYMQFYGIFSKVNQSWACEINGFDPPEWLDLSLIRKLEESGRYWFREKRIISLVSEDGEGDPIRANEELPEAKRRKAGKDIRMRLKGCGDRHLAPIEGTYYCDTQAYDALEVIARIIGVLGIEKELECFGDKWVLTIPKELSAKLDRLRGSEEWRKKIKKLFNAGAGIIKGFHPEGELAMVAGMDLSGEEKPWEAHYHFNYYVLPVVRKDGKWELLKRWLEKEVLEEVRKIWKKKVERIFGVELEEIDIKRGYLRSWRRVVHFVRYLFRHPLEDLWKGWEGFRNNKVTYFYRKGLKTETLEADGEEVLEAFNRVKDLPHSFKRIRYFGWLGNNQRGQVLKGLGFEVKDAGDLAEGWEKVGLYEVKEFGKENWTFKKVNPHGEGEGEITVPISKLCFCPSDTVGGKRVWIPPKPLGALVAFALRNGGQIIRPP